MTPASSQPMLLQGLHGGVGPRLGLPNRHISPLGLVGLLPRAAVVVWPRTLGLLPMVVTCSLRLADLLPMAAVAVWPRTLGLAEAEEGAMRGAS